ncbi:hypothetical protein Q8F55_001444 [Vanrija albida]|uniref:BZIP domain-containing protein n=1 Tax=Vanrija albida TaxID=181172 RepID=A0ABR3QG07_9TREE
MSTPTSDEARRDRRRAINRRAQQRSREQKQTLIERLQAENAALRARFGGGSGESSSLGTALDSNSVSPLPPHHSSSSASASLSPPTAQPPSAASTDLDALRQAFLAVLASVCDPHLNTIHAICAKFAQSRGRAVAAGDLHPPRPVNRPLNAAGAVSPDGHANGFDAQQHQHLHAHSHGHGHGHGHAPHDAFGAPADANAWLDDLLATLLPPAAYITTDPEAAGPLSVPLFEPAHPINGVELDASGVWALVVATVDLSRTDAEYLASRLTDKIRCYGFGPVLLQHEVEGVCADFPLLSWGAVAA